MTPEQSVREFRLYQEEVVRFLGETEGAAQSRRGDTRLLDIDAVMRRVRRTYGVPFGARDLLLS